MSTEEELGYRDAMRQVHRAMKRRLKVLEDECADAENEKCSELKIRIREVKYLIHAMESLRR